MKLFKTCLYFLSIILLSILFPGCATVDDERIPNMPVNISIADAGMWNTYGVSGFGTYKIFTLNPRQPSSFPYSQKSYTGFGGVLLIEGVDPFSGNSSMPLAYDLACPVERVPETRVAIDPESYMAICPVCGSSYDVTMQRGAPVGGPALMGKYKYGLKNYTCLSTGGGYIITN